MKIINNVLENNTLQLIEQDFKNFSRGYNWSASELLWPENIRYGISGNTLATMVPDETNILILSNIYKLLPFYNNITLQYYIWTPNSGISFHDDGHHKFGATIYLNKKPWDKNYGGLFLYENEDKETMTAICPKYNTLIINDTKTRHSVSLISSLAKENRMTIQIWGD